MPTVVTEDERVAVEPDGSVSRQAERVEYAPARRRRNRLVPALLIILAIALAAIAAAWYFSQSDTATVPSVVGLPLDSAVTRLEDDGFKADIVSQPNEAAQGIVFRQSPGAGHRAGRGLAGAAARLEGPGRRDGSEHRRRDGDRGARPAGNGRLQGQRRAGVLVERDRGRRRPGSCRRREAAKGSEVRLNVSKGTAQVDVPSVVGLSQADATAQVKAAGLAPISSPVPSDEPAGTVVAQNPAGGQADRGSNVRLNVSSGP